MSESPLVQFTAFKIRLYCVPICAIEPVDAWPCCLSVGKLPCEISGVSFVSRWMPHQAQGLLDCAVGKQAQEW